MRGMKLSNQEIAGIFYEIAEFLAMENIQFKPRAYEKVASAVESLDESVYDIYKKEGLKGLKNIPNVGESIAEKIEEIVKTGRLKYYEELKKRTPIDLKGLEKIEGLGPKGIRKLYKEIGIKNLDDLEKAAEAGKIRELDGFGKKAEENILKGIEFAKQSGSRFILGYAMTEISEVIEGIKSLKEVQKIKVVGSARRKKETIGDIDILVQSDSPKPIMNYFVGMPGVVRVYDHGENKSNIRHKNGMDMDLRILPEESFGAALLYFTGSKEFNIELRKIAVKKGEKLNEYGLFKEIRNKKEKRIAGKTEEEVFEKLDMQYIEPEMRENQGEIELALRNKLPKLIGYGDLKGDLQIQTNWTDGSNTIEEYAKEAIKLGLEYILITDHTKRLAMTGGLDEKGLLKQIKAIDKANEKFKNKNFRILKGSEVDILKDGTLDIKDEVLKKLDIVGASVHSYFNLSREEQTKRLIKAMENKNVDIIFHPTGRIINRRKAYDLDIDEIIKTAKRTKTVLEIDAYPDRLDLKDEHIKKCVDAGVKLAIDSDAHAIPHMHYLKWGIAQARRGWAIKNDIINAHPLGKLLKFLKQ